MPPNQRVSANAIAALKEALVAVFWFKRDLYAWAKAAVAGEPVFLAGIGWTDPGVYKRDSVETFVDRLVREQDEHQILLLGIIVDVAAMDEFPQLRRTDDPETKIAEARAAVKRLKALVRPYEQVLAEDQAHRDRIAAARSEADASRATKLRLTELKDRLVALESVEPRARGFQFEGLLRDLFDCFDLDPKASFRLSAEQIDGGFSLDQEHFLLEAKWEKKLADREDLDVFRAKVSRRSENTLGLFVAISGFAPSAVETHSGVGSPLLLVDGADLFAVLDDRIDLRVLLRRKRRHAAMTGEVLLSASRILGDG